MGKANGKQLLVSGKHPIIGVGAVIYRYDRKGRLSVLLIKKEGGYWTLPKGQLKRDESELDALEREVAEETQLRGTPGPLIHTVRYKIMKRGSLRHKQVAYYLFAAPGGVAKPSASERIERVAWFSPRAAIRRIKRRRIRTVLALAVEHLTGRRDEAEQTDATCSASHEQPVSP
jgi:8-oxo-dGTP diphosphatase